MHLLEVGLDHHTADVTLRERLAIPDDALADALGRLGEIVTEAVVISTCNRVELYVLVDRPDLARRNLIAELAQWSGLAEDRLAAALTLRQDADAVRHLFRVACGLESMIVGEPEVAGQVRRALKAADRLAERSRGGLADRTVLVVGAGAVARGIARTLADLGPSRLLIASRRLESARALADLVGAEALGLEQLSTGLEAADAVISATAAPTPVVTAEQVRSALDA